MRRLFDFLVRYNYWFLFIFLEVTSFVLLFRFSNYQRSVMYTSASEVAGRVYEVEGMVTGYLNLREINQDLLRRNLELERRATYYERKLKDLVADSARYESLQDFDGKVFESIPARVIHNTLREEDNFITLSGGNDAGIKPDMGVVDARGVVGIVYKTSAHYALVLPLLNSKSNLSCKLKGTEYFGYLNWDGKDARYATLKDLPRHAEFTLGDTIVTSGYSTVFPEGLMVGTVDDVADSNDGLSYLLKVRLATNFSALTDVRVISTENKEERDLLESMK